MHNRNHGFLSLYLIQMRPYLLFISGAAGAAGMAFGAAMPSMLLTLIGFLPLFLGYGFGQALTDCFQTDTDSLSAPYRPLSNGSLRKGSVLITSLAGLTLSALVYVLLQPMAAWVCLLVIFTLATYTFVKKNITILAPFYNAATVAMLPILGYMVTMRGEAAFTIPASLWWISAMSLFSYANFVLIGYLKDVEADRQTGYRTFPVVYGWNATLWFGALLAAGAAWSFLRLDPASVMAKGAGILGLVVLVAGLLHAAQLPVKNEQTALVPILCTVRSFLLLHMAVVLEYRPGWLPALVIFYAAFEWVLYRRPSKYQV